MYLICVLHCFHFQISALIILVLLLIRFIVLDTRAIYRRYQRRLAIVNRAAAIANGAGGALFNVRAVPAAP